MKFLKVSIVSIIIAIIIFFLGFNFIYREKSENFFKEGVKQVYINKGIKGHNYKFVEKEMIEKGKEDQWKKINLGRKALKDIYVFSFDSLDSQLSNEVIVVDTGLGYFPIKSKITDYFDEYSKEEDIFIMKEEKKPKKLEGMDIYLKPYKGYFIVATSDKIINFFLKMPKAENTTLIDLDKESKNGSLGKVIIDFSKVGLFKALGINGAVTGLDIEDEKLKISNEFYGEGFLRNSLEDQPEERKYEDFIGKDRIYISGNNLGSSIAMALKGAGSKEIENFNMVFNMLGITIEDVFNQIDGEIIMDVKNSSGMIPLKDTKNIKSLFRIFGQKDKMVYGDKEISLDGNLLKIGSIEEAEDRIKIKKENFIYGDLAMDLYDRSFTEGARGILSGKTTKKSILMELELNEEATKNIAEEVFK